jgi:hypothetical protein
MANGGWRMEETERAASQEPKNMSNFLKGVAMIGALCAAALLVVGGPAAAAEAKGKTFASPEEAVKALVAAAGDSKAVLAILGPEARPIINSGDAAADKADRDRFLKSYGEASKLVKASDDMVLLAVGKD